MFNLLVNLIDVILRYRYEWKTYKAEAMFRNVLTFGVLI